MHERGVVVLFDDFRVLDLIIQLDDFAFVCRLFVARRVVLGIFRKVAVAARLGDAFDDLLAFLIL